MTEAKREKPTPHKHRGKPPRNLIPKPISQAFLAGASSGIMSYVFGVPVEYLPRVALAGAGFSLWLSWQDSRYETAPKKKKGRSIDFNHGKGSTKIYPDMEYSMSAGGYLVRESYWQGLRRKLSGNPGPVARQSQPVARPKILDEFVFISHYQGQAIQLREIHVKLFLASAWRLPNGKGLSMRHWIRRRSQRPAWYKELSPIWYFGMSMLIWDTQRGLNRQLVITLDNRQSFLTTEPHELYALLRWYESEKNNARKNRRIN